MHDQRHQKLLSNANAGQPPRRPRRDTGIDLWQRWLDGYHFEVYLMIKLLKLRSRTAEVPISKIYPPKAAGNTKMRPLVDWWHMLGPIFVVGLGLDRPVEKCGGRSLRQESAS
jgi:hypothetical protein